MGLPVESYIGDWGLIALTAGITGWLIFWLYKSKKYAESLSLALIIGGAIGNLIDRFLHGAVVDFVHLHAFGYNFYVFNIADAAISFGVVLLLLESFLGSDLQLGENASKEDKTRFKE